jgi:RNase P/RNase MRP subunit p30
MGKIITVKDMLDFGFNMFKLMIAKEQQEIKNDIDAVLKEIEKNKNLKLDICELEKEYNQLEHELSESFAQYEIQLKKYNVAINNPAINNNN